MSWCSFHFLSLFDVLGEFCEGSIETFFIGVIVIPFLCGFRPILRVIIFRLVGVGLVVESLVMRGEGGSGGI